MSLYDSTLEDDMQNITNANLSLRQKAEYFSKDRAKFDRKILELEDSEIEKLKNQIETNKNKIYKLLSDIKPIVTDISYILDNIIKIVNNNSLTQNVEQENVNTINALVKNIINRDSHTIENLSGIKPIEITQSGSKIYNCNIADEHRKYFSQKTGYNNLIKHYDELLFKIDTIYVDVISRVKMLLFLSLILFESTFVYFQIYDVSNSILSDWIVIPLALSWSLSFGVIETIIASLVTKNRVFNRKTRFNKIFYKITISMIALLAMLTSWFIMEDSFINSFSIINILIASITLVISISVLTYITYKQLMTKFLKIDIREDKKVMYKNLY